MKISMKGYRGIEYFRGDRNSFIRIKIPHKWEVWWKGDFFEVVPTRKFARDCLRDMQQSEEEIDAEDLEIYRKAVAAIKKLPGTWILIGRLSERVERTCSRVVREETLTKLKVAQDEGERLLRVVTRFYKNHGDFGVE